MAFSGDWNRNHANERIEYLKREKAKRIERGLAEQEKAHAPEAESTPAPATEAR
jgi:hypothetical protein